MGNERRVTVGGGETVTWGVAVNWNSEVYNTQTNASICIDKIDIRTIHLLSSTHQDGSVWIRCRLLRLSDIPTVLLLIKHFTKHKVNIIVSLIDGRYQSRLVRPCLSSLLFLSYHVDTLKTTVHYGYRSLTHVHQQRDDTQLYRRRLKVRGEREGVGVQVA